MSTVKRVKQLLMVTGLLTILAVIAMAGVAVYLWWDTRDGVDEVDIDSDYSTATEDDFTVDTGSIDDDGSIDTSETDSADEPGTAAE